jgi:hypothetical protein
MSTFKGNYNIESALSNFIEVVEQETGLKISDVDCYIHRADEAQVEAALKVEGAFKRSDCIKVVDDHSVWGLADVDVIMFPLDESILQGEEEEEDPFFECERCSADTAKDEAHSDVENMCHDCGEATMHEWEQENQQQQSDYRRDVL